jgi:hypothetical protein
MTTAHLSPVTLAKRQQAQWAARCGIAADARGYVSALDDNLLLPLSDATARDFTRGSGSELDGKMRALHSSSALAVNVFEHWRQAGERTALADAFGLDRPIVDVRFEQQFDNHLPGMPPNLDVVLALDGGSIMAIESKFLEPYGRHVHGFKPKYFEALGAWTAHGLTACQSLADELQGDPTIYRWLHAEQLLKHIVGLAASARVPWTLLYLWYEVPGPEASAHAEEVAAFARQVSADGISFQALTYQVLLAGLRPRVTNEDAEYVAYLEERYFAGDVGGSNAPASSWR